MHTILSNIISSMVYEFCLIFKFIKVISPLFQTAQLICWLARAFSPVFQVLYFIYQRGAGNRSSNFLEILINLCISQHLTQVPSTWMIIKWRRKVGRGRAGVWRKVTWFAHDSSSHSKNQKDENGYFCSIKEHTVSVWIGIPCDGQASILLNECHHERTAASWLLTWKRCHQPPQRFNIGLAVKS